MLNRMLPRVVRPSTPADYLRGTFFITVTADEAAQRWADNLGQASQKIQQGVERVTQAPGQAAAAAGQKWQMSLQGQDVLQRFQANVGAVPLASWQQDMIQKGLPRISTGAAAAIPKMTTVFASLLRFEQTLQQQVRGMDSSSYAAREARMLAWARGMRNFKKPAGT